MTSKFPSTITSRLLTSVNIVSLIPETNSKLFASRLIDPSAAITSSSPSIRKSPVTVRVSGNVKVPSARIAKLVTVGISSTNTRSASLVTKAVEADRLKAVFVEPISLITILPPAVASSSLVTVSMPLMSSRATLKNSPAFPISPPASSTTRPCPA